MAFTREAVKRAGRDRQIETLGNDLIKGEKELVKVATISCGDVKDVLISKLKPFSKHTYNIMEDKVEEYKESIRDYGLFTPIIVWDNGEDKYEILAGHHRVEACKRLGKETIPAVIKKELSEEEAITIANQTNMIQRSFEQLTLYEKASSIMQMKEAREKLEEKRPELKERDKEDEYSSNSKESKSGIRSVAREFGVSKSQVARYLQLYNSFSKNQFSYMEDTTERKAYFDYHIGSEQIAKLSKTTIKELFNFLDNSPVKKISRGQAKELVERYKENDNKLTDKDFNEILIYSEINKKQNKPITFKREMLNKYFDEDMSEQEIMNEIINMLEQKGNIQ